MTYQKKLFIKDENKRGSNNMLWEFFKRYNKLNKLKNNNSINFVDSLNKIMTFKECEIVYKLPPNTVIRDYKNGTMQLRHARKSNDTYLITIDEAARLYERYWLDRARRQEGHLYSGWDGKKMTELEFKIKYGNSYDPIESIEE